MPSDETAEQEEEEEETEGEEEEEEEGTEEEEEEEEDMEEKEEVDAKADGQFLSPRAHRQLHDGDGPQLPRTTSSSSVPGSPGAGNATWEHQQGLWVKTSPGG